MLAIEGESRRELDTRFQLKHLKDRPPMGI